MINNSLQLRLELQISLQQWIDSTMKQFNISSAMMEDAMTKVLIQLKDKVFQDYLMEQQKAYQEALKQQQEASSATLRQEEDANGGFSN